MNFQEARDILAPHAKHICIRAEAWWWSEQTEAVVEYFISVFTHNRPDECQQVMADTIERAVNLLLGKIASTPESLDEMQANIVGVLPPPEGAAVEASGNTPAPELREAVQS